MDKKEEEVFKVTEQRMTELLHPNILESELDLATKKVLAGMCDWYLNSEAMETKIVIIDNKTLISIAGVGGTSLQKALRQLQDYNLIERKIGTGLGNASQYIINFKLMGKPLKRKSFAELYGIEDEESESPEKPISTIVHNSISHNISDKPISSYYSPDDTITDYSLLEEGISDEYSLGESFSEEGIAGDSGYEEDVFGTNTYLNRQNSKEEVSEMEEDKKEILDVRDTVSVQELEEEFCEGMTEPMTKNEVGACEDSPIQSLSQDEIPVQQEENGSCTPKPQLTESEEFKHWKDAVSPELEKMKQVTSRAEFHQMEKDFYKFYDSMIKETGFTNERVKKRMDSHIEDFISTQAYIVYSKWM